MWLKHGIFRYAEEPAADCLQCETCKLYTGDIQGHLKHKISLRHKLQSEIFALEQHANNRSTAAASDVVPVDTFTSQEPADDIETEQHFNSHANTITTGSTDNTQHEHAEMNVAAVLPLLAQVSTTAETSYPELVLPSRAGDTYESSNGAHSRLLHFDMFTLNTSCQYLPLTT